jgi:hypothetical protein
VKPRNKANEIILESIRYFVFLKGGSFNPCGGKFGAHASSCGVGLPSKFYFLPASLTDWLPLVSTTCNSVFLLSITSFETKGM